MGPSPRHASGGREGAASDRAGAVVRAHVWVAGRVQGVGFRVFVLERAHRLGLAGFVRNRLDGGVEIVAEGPEHSVEALLSAVRRGPAGARVSAVDVSWDPPHHETGFSVRDDARA